MLGIQAGEAPVKTPEITRGLRLVVALAFTLATGVPPNGFGAVIRITGHGADSSPLMSWPVPLLR